MFVKLNIQSENRKNTFLVGTRNFGGMGQLIFVEKDHK
jgi:hypothetical protein